MRSITVFGATGAQGGGVIKGLLQDGNWKIRAVTRNVDGEKAKALAKQGVEVVFGNLDQPATIADAVKGVEAVFAVTNFWDNILQGGKRAQEIEEAQGITVAQAAANSPTLKHYIWSTAPSSSKRTDGKFVCPYTDSKYAVDEYIHNKLPELAKKTTFLWCGFYGNNFTEVPINEPQLIPAVGSHVVFQPVDAEVYMPVAGDVVVNIGIAARAILAKPEVTLPSRYYSVQTETITMRQCLDIWTQVTGYPVIHIHVSQNEWNQLFPWAALVVDQMRYFKAVPDWRVPNMLTEQDLGIEGQLMGLKETLEKNVTLRK